MCLYPVRQSVKHRADIDGVLEIPEYTLYLCQLLVAHHRILSGEGIIRRADEELAIEVNLRPYPGPVELELATLRLPDVVAVDWMGTQSTRGLCVGLSVKLL